MVREADSRTPSLAELGHLLVQVGIVSAGQWATATAGGATDPSIVLDRLEDQPAEWLSSEPALSCYQRKCIEKRLAKGLRDLDRDLRVNDFLIRAHLGDGGMGSVFLAWSIEMRRLVAVKRLTSNNPHLRDRMAQEAVILRKLKHPTIARYVAYEVNDDGDGSVLAMEYIQGPTLREYCDRHKSVPTELAVGWTVQLLEALAHAHSHGVIHRDLTPRNIIIVTPPDAAPFPRLVDFGLAKLSEATMGLTMAQTAIGTPQFMPPEQFADATNVTAASDLYSLGCNLFLMLTGRPPFEGTQFPALCLAHTNQTPPRVRDLVPVPQHVDAAVAQMLLKIPAARGSVSELVRKLTGSSSSGVLLAGAVPTPTPLPSAAAAAVPRERLAAATPVPERRPDFTPLQPAAQAVLNPPPRSFPPEISPAREPAVAERKTTPSVRMEQIAFDHPQRSWWGWLLPVSPLAACTRFIDREHGLVSLLHAFRSPWRLAAAAVAVAAVIVVLIGIVIAAAWALAG